MGYCVQSFGYFQGYWIFWKINYGDICQFIRDARLFTLRGTPYTSLIHLCALQSCVSMGVPRLTDFRHLWPCIKLDENGDFHENVKAPWYREFYASLLKAYSLNLWSHKWAIFESTFSVQHLYFEFVLFTRKSRNSSFSLSVLFISLLQRWVGYKRFCKRVLVVLVTVFTLMLLFNCGGPSKMKTIGYTRLVYRFEKC